MLKMIRLSKTMELTFNNSKHEYRLDGVIIPSVTQVLEESGLICLDCVPEDLLEATSDLGAKVHKATELYDLEELDINQLHPKLKRYLDGWIKFRKDYQFVPIESELQMFHPLYRYAGRLDRVGECLTLVDIKSGTKQKSHSVQTAAYKGLYDYGKKKSEQIKRRLIVYLSESGYKVEENKDPNDMTVFLSALTITNYKRGNQ
jgi:hypothetical protein